MNTTNLGPILSVLADAAILTKEKDTRERIQRAIELIKAVPKFKRAEDGMLIPAEGQAVAVQLLPNGDALVQDSDGNIHLKEKHRE